MGDYCQWGTLESWGGGKPQVGGRAIGWRQKMTQVWVGQKLGLHFWDVTAHEIMEHQRFGLNSALSKGWGPTCTYLYRSIHFSGSTVVYWFMLMNHDQRVLDFESHSVHVPLRLIATWSTPSW